jgi:hypothetical protein
MPRVLLILVFLSSMFAAAPKPAPANDAVIEAAIRAKFAKSKISADNFRVSVRSGVALIEGKTDVPQRKGVATRLARTGGAREVVNKIQIGDAARKKLTDRLQKARDSKSQPKPAGSPSAAVTQQPQTESSPPRMQLKRQ